MVQTAVAKRKVDRPMLPLVLIVLGAELIIRAAWR
jgi:hypothetical protein